MQETRSNFTFPLQFQHGGHFGFLLQLASPVGMCKGILPRAWRMNGVERPRCRYKWMPLRGSPHAGMGDEPHGRALAPVERVDPRFHMHSLHSMRLHLSRSCSRTCSFLPSHNHSGHTLRYHVLLGHLAEHASCLLELLPIPGIPARGLARGWLASTARRDLAMEVLAMELPEDAVDHGLPHHSRMERPKLQVLTNSYIYRSRTSYGHHRIPGSNAFLMHFVEHASSKFPVWAYSAIMAFHETLPGSWSLLDALFCSRMLILVQNVLGYTPNPEHYCRISAQEAAAHFEVSLVLSLRNASYACQSFHQELHGFFLRGRARSMQPLWRLTVWLACVWVATLLYGEFLAFWLPRWSCSWPDLEQKFASTISASDRPLKVALIADPQLTDRTSYGMAPGSMALKIIEFYSDIYMRRAFRSSVLGLEPDEIIFLGDHFDGGPYLSDVEWDESLKRFQHVFDQSQRGLKSRSKRMVPVHYLSGNHDLGYHEIFSQNPKVLERYRKEFGKTDYSLKIGGVDFIVVNSQSLDGSKAEPNCNSSWSFIEQASQSASDSLRGPKILLTHIPLYRPDNTPCGSDRASPVINQRLRRTNWSPWRIIYQDYLTNETSLMLLNLTKPVMVFSGHDHDQCKVLHSTSEGSYPEYTVGTFSWQQGNIYPSFMMLSVTPRASAVTDAIVSEKLCFLPAQDFIYIWYAVLLVISVVALSFWPSQGLDLRPAFEHLYETFKSTATAKEKDEDADWEMVWDAEGAMHLMNKGYSRDSTSQQSQSTDRRGTAVLRAAAKSKAVAPSDDGTESDANTSLSSSHRSKMFPFRRRCFQMVGPLVVLVAMNFSLYMMLVMKDWT